MRITVNAVGRQKRGPDRDLVDDYRTRADAAGRKLGLSPVSVIEIDAKGGPVGEAAALNSRITADAFVIVLDERGRDLPTDDLAGLIARERDDGRRDMAIVIGGADGLAEEIRARADETVRFGRQTWPHMLVRIMAMEQVYRAITILAGHPYHRGG